MARAIAACSVPVISAVGHETDFTIADFVADLRAPTPSAAAEMVIATRQSLVDRMDAAESKLRQAARLTLALLARRLAQQSRWIPRGCIERWDAPCSAPMNWITACATASRIALERRKRAVDLLATRLGLLDVRLRLAGSRRRLEAFDGRMRQAMRHRFTHARSELTPLEAHLYQLSPLKILERGYAIVEQDGKLVKSPADAPEGSDVRVRLARGEIAARVIPQDRLKR